MPNGPDVFGRQRDSVARQQRNRCRLVETFFLRFFACELAFRSDFIAARRLRNVVHSQRIKRGARTQADQFMWKKG